MVSTPRFRFVRLALIGLGVCCCAAAASAEPMAADAALSRLADDYIDSTYLPADPTRATLLGVHDFDDRLEDLSAVAIAGQIERLQGFAARFAAIDPATLSEHAAGDLALLTESVRGSLLNWQTIKPWQHNPDVYPSGLAAAAFALIERKFAPADERLRKLVAREALMPAFLATGRANLVDPPPVFTKVALQQLPGTIAFFKTDVPLAFAGAGDAALQAEFARRNQDVVLALEAYAAWVRTDLLPRSHGDFRLGAATFRAKLQHDEMVDMPLPELLAIGRADLARNQQEFARVAKLLAPRQTARQVLADLGADHPQPDRLLASFRSTFDGLQAFIADHHIIGLPSDVQPILEETPPFMRATTFASMDTPGPFEAPDVREAYFNVTLPEAGWPKARVDGFMAQFSTPVISNVVVHEAYPGHYVQFLWVQQQTDRVRKIFGAASNAEGWAHYCEQMMLDEGYAAPGDHSPRAALWLRLGQLQDALLRDARYIVGIEMHTGQMTLAQGMRFFVDQGYQSAEVGRVEATRGTADPTYLYYTLGKLQILQLRDDLKARQGAAYSLEGFHDAFMQQGFPPIKLVRRALLHDDSPTLTAPH